MNKIKRTCIAVLMLGVFALAFVGISGVFASGSPNFGWSKEHLQLKFQGYVQAQGAFRERIGGSFYHARRGYMKFFNASDGDTYQTDHTFGPDDESIHYKEIWVWDSLNPFAPQVVFDYRHSWNPEGAPWPESIGEVDK